VITPPPTWRRSLGHQLLVLTPPSGRARLRYHERLEPRPFDALVETLTAGFRVKLRGPTSRFITEEGEYGAWCTLAGEDAEGPARRWIGVVVLDEFVAALDASTNPWINPSSSPSDRTNPPFTAVTAVQPPVYLTRLPMRPLADGPHVDPASA
jgi:hypothetical protein